jgi:Ion channel
VPRLLQGRRRTAEAAPGPRRRPVRSRVSRLRAAHSYRSVLVLILATFLFASLAGDQPWTVSVLLLLQAGTLGMALWTSGLAKADSKGLLAVLVTSLAIAVALLFTSPANFKGGVGIVSGLLVLGTIVVIAIGVVDQKEVNAQSITGAVCIYLLFGIVFMFFYSASAIIGDGDFFAQGTDGTRALRLYFSFVTLATLGYGDYTPARQLGRMLAIVEALLGQLYLVTVLALLVSRLQGRRLDRDSDS